MIDLLAGAKDWCAAVLRCSVPLTGPVFAWLPIGSVHGVGRPRERRLVVTEIGHIGQDFPMRTVFTR